MEILIDSCEACHHAPRQRLIASDDPAIPYQVCEPCAHRLLTYSLRPQEWFRLAALHGPHQYYLHDDFYSDTGVAQQPEEKVIDAEQFPFPTLEQINTDVDLLIDYALTRFFLDAKDEIVQVLKQKKKELLLSRLQTRLASPHSPEIEARIYELCAYVLKRSAESWIRSRWATYHPTLFTALALASASCLPLEEGFHLVVQGLEKIPPRDLHAYCHVFIWFRTEATLDWLETHIHPPVTDDWGRVAALSQLTWERVSRWLERGRPLSLVALDALKAYGCYDTPLLRQLSPKLLKPETKEKIIAKLAWYLSHDAAPRVKQKVTAILSRLDTILS